MKSKKIHHTLSYGVGYDKLIKFDDLSKSAGAFIRKGDGTVIVPFGVCDSDTRYRGQGYVRIPGEPHTACEAKEVPCLI